MDTANKEDGQNGRVPTNEPEPGARAASVYILNYKREGFMWVSRMATLYYTLSYFLAFTSGNPYTYYYKALIANCVTNIIRLNQRLPPFQFSRAYLGLFLVEDSCHYVLYTLIFLYNYPATLVLLPISLFAILHSSCFNVKILTIYGGQDGWLATMMSSFIQDHSNGIFRLIAYTEIFLMPMNVFFIFIGKGNLLTPVIYYRFLTLRYQSKRNPYSRLVFYELRLLVEVMARHSAVPQRLKWLCHKLVELVSRLAPPVAPA